MKRAWPITTVATIVALTLARVILAQAPPVETDAAALLRLEQEWANAVANHEPACIERVEADTYVYTDAAGNVAHKADDLATARAGDLKIDSFRLNAMKVQLYGDAAVVTGETTVSGTDRSGPLTGIFRWTDVFVRRNDCAWQVVASQATAISSTDNAPILVMPAETPVEASPSPSGTTMDSQN